MTVSRLGIEHIDAMADLHAAAFPKPEAWEAQAFHDLLSVPTTQAFGVWEDPALVALLLVQFIDPELEVLTIATAPAMRRQGLARRLIEQVERELQPQKSMLDVAADNLSAIAFYETQGFFADGRRTGYYKRLEGERVDAILMTKR